MRLSTVFVSTAFVLAGMSAALPGESENILARFADDFLAEVDARAYDEESELYAQRGAISTKNHKPRSATPHYGSSEYDNGLVTREYVLSRDGSSGTPLYTSHFRRSFYEPPRYELTRRHHSPPPTPGYSTPPTPGTPSTPVRDWRNRLPRPYSPTGSVPPTPGFSTPPTPGTPSTPVRDWRNMPPAPYSPGSGERTVPGSPDSSRLSSPPYVPGSPGRGGSRSPEWHRPRNDRSHYRRSFYDLD
ncbi:hypothetical protein JOM56_001399 [Amanita muscaria]